jgi:hypothetical protein
MRRVLYLISILWVVPYLTQQPKIEMEFVKIEDSRRRIHDGLRAGRLRLRQQ